jgi:hypothetical protein
MSKNHQSWEQPKRDPIKDIEKLKEDILRHALMPRERRPLLIGLKTYEFLQANYPDCFKNYEVITDLDLNPNQ